VYDAGDFPQKCSLILINITFDSTVGSC
jgi:hypothetical protein